MKRKTIWLVVSCLIVVALLPASCAPATVQEEAPTPAEELVTEEEGEEKSAAQEEVMVTEAESQEIAVEFLRNSPTFKFDGMENTLKLAQSEAGENPYNWAFHYQFQSRHAGYGDRTGLILAQVIIDHRARIVVERGEVVQAVLDGKWDMLGQRMIE